jgi:hypothetical protein
VIHRWLALLNKRNNNSPLKIELGGNNLGIGSGEILALSLSLSLFLPPTEQREGKRRKSKNSHLVQTEETRSSHTIQVGRGKNNMSLFY